MSFNNEVVSIEQNSEIENKDTVVVSECTEHDLSGFDIGHSYYYTQCICGENEIFKRKRIEELEENAIEIILEDLLTIKAYSPKNIELIDIFGKHHLLRKGYSFHIENNYLITSLDLQILLNGIENKYFNTVLIENKSEVQNGYNG